MKRMLDMEDFPMGTRVTTPSGRTGVVTKHRGSESKFDHFQRITVLLDGKRKNDYVTLQPHLLTKNPPEDKGEPRIEA